MSTFTTRTDCCHIETVGDRVRFVDSGCPRAELYLGTFVVIPYKCSDCRAYRKQEMKVRKKRYG